MKDVLHRQQLSPLTRKECPLRAHRSNRATPPRIAARFPLQPSKNPLFQPEIVHSAAAPKSPQISSKCLNPCGLSSFSSDRAPPSAPPNHPRTPRKPPHNSPQSAL